LVSVGHCVVCLLRFTDSGYLFGTCWPLCCLSSSIYGFWLSLWNLLAIVLSVFFDLHILAISLVSVGHCVVCLLRFTDSGYLFGTCWPLCCLSSSIYGFWLSLWNLLAIVLSVFFDLQILVISLVPVGHCVVCLLRFTDSGYLFGICWPLCCLSSSIYIFWLSLWYLLAIVLSVFFDLHILVISLVSFGHFVFSLLRFKDSGYLFGICWSLCCLSSSI
jgi:tetrahydromethanopterin S-methyltransferase subunit B